jgi:hypothetical protein
MKEASFSRNQFPLSRPGLSGYDRIRAELETFVQERKTTWEKPAGLRKMPFLHDRDSEVER